MDLHSRRPGMFENSRSSGMWPAEPPPATSPFSPHSPALQVSQRSGRCSDAYLHPLLAPPSFHDPPFTSRGHQLGAPNSRVTKDAPLAWHGRARLLGAQMMYVDHFCLSSFLALAHAAVIAFAFRALLPRTYAQARLAERRFYRNDKEQREEKDR